MGNPIDLSRLPAPDVIEALNYETIFGVTLADMRGRFPDLANLDSEADPVFKLMQTTSYREMIVRARVNDGARAVMLPFAQKADLDQLAALFGLVRQVLDPGDPDANPPVDPTYESDDRLRSRTQLAPSALSTAGPASAYRYHALNASATVSGVHVASPSPGQVTVTILAAILADADDGTAPATLLATVTAALSDETVRPMGDVLTVQSAIIVDYMITAVLTIGTGPDAAAVLTAATAAVRATAGAHHRLGAGMPRSALFAALHVPGVTAVNLTNPAADVAASAVQATYATAIQVTAA